MMCALGGCTPLTASSDDDDTEVPEYGVVRGDMGCGHLYDESPEWWIGMGVALFHEAGSGIESISRVVLSFPLADEEPAVQGASIELGFLQDVQDEQIQPPESVWSGEQGFGQEAIACSYVRSIPGRLVIEDTLGTTREFEVDYW